MNSAPAKPTRPVVLRTDAEQLPIDFPDEIVGGLIDPAINTHSMQSDGLWHYTSRATVEQFQRAIELLPDSLKSSRLAVLEHNKKMLERGK